MMEFSGSEKANAITNRKTISSTLLGPNLRTLTKDRVAKDQDNCPREFNSQTATFESETHGSPCCLTGLFSLQDKENGM